MKLSFVIPSHNCAAWLPHAVKSVQQQKISAEIEIIIVDDNSTDSTKKYLGWLHEHEKRANVYCSTVHLGRSQARNKGNKMATGEYIFVLDADDYAHPNRAKLTLEKFKGDTQFVYGSAEVMGVLADKQGNIMADTFNKDLAIKSLMNRIVHSSVAYTKQFSELYPYREGAISDLGIDDWAQQIEAAVDGIKFDFCPQTLVAYRILQSGISHTRDEAKVLEEKKRFLEKLTNKLVA